MVGQGGDILRSLAKRREVNRDHIEAVVEVLAEGALADHRFEVAVGGSDHAHIHADRLRPSNTLELALLKHAQELHLHRQADIADLIEQECATVSALEPADMPRQRVRECALLVAEKLAFEERFRKSNHS